VQFGFIPLIGSILLMLLVHALPDAMADRPKDLEHVQAILGQGPRVMIAGIIAYGTSQTLNVLIFSRLRGESGNLLWLRAGVASVLSQIFDTVLFISIAFYGRFPIGDLLVGQMLAKVVLSAVMVPPLIYAFVALGRRLDRA
jgi:queuosine precursor transporter